MSKGCTLEKQEMERIFSRFALEAKKQITQSFEKPHKPVIVIAGPTGTGKTQFSIDLAKLINGEIVSADSMQVYRGMDIGTAKATLQQRSEVPHHLIDIQDVSQPYNVVDFYYDARHCFQKIHDRGATPIVVGGSGFYLHTLIYGPPSGPPSVPELRASLEKEIEEQGSDVLFERLKKLDPEYAGTITPNDKQKIVRALEIITLTGKSVSRLSWKGRKKPRNYDFRCWFLCRPKETLYQRINDRCDQMIKEGLLQEVEKLKQMGIEKNNSVMQAIGYRQALEYLRSNQTSADYRHFVDSFKKASRNYAKRQFTWFRREQLFHWLDLDLHDYEVAIDMVRQDFERLI